MRLLLRDNKHADIQVTFGGLAIDVNKLSVYNVVEDSICTYLGDMKENLPCARSCPLFIINYLNFANILLKFILIPLNKCGIVLKFN